MRSKRGQEKVVLPPVFTAIIGFGFVFLTILYAVMNVGAGEGFKQQLYVLQLGFDTQTVQSMPELLSEVMDLVLPPRQMVPTSRFPN